MGKSSDTETAALRADVTCTHCQPTGSRIRLWTPGQEAQLLSLLEWPEGQEPGIRILVVALTDNKSHFSLWACFLISTPLLLPSTLDSTGDLGNLGSPGAPRHCVKNCFHLSTWTWKESGTQTVINDWTNLTPKFEIQRNQVLLKATRVQNYMCIIGSN